MKMANVKRKCIKRTGFTLIELLVVISIIGLLTTIAVISTNSARVKGRDTKRIADLKQINTALELYSNDIGHYPITPTWACFDCASYVNTAILTPAATNLTAAMAPYLPKAPVDPLGFAGDDSGYLYISPDGINYKLFSWRRPENMCNYPPSLIDTVRCGSVTAACVCSNGRSSNTAAFWAGTGIAY